MDTLRVRAYNVRFGDAILISVPDRDEKGNTEIRHILVDVGNVLGSEGGLDDVFEPIVSDILAVLDGKPLDLYVMTHEHLDHVQGLFYAAENLDLRFDACYAWLTGSAAEDYYETHKEAEERKLELDSVYAAIEGYLAAGGDTGMPDAVQAILLNNNPRSTSQCVDYLRTLASIERTFYVHREFSLEAGEHHPFSETKLELWAPEENTAQYYGRFRPMTLGVSGADGASQTPTLTRITPPAGVDAGAFYNLVERRRGYAENLLAIDKAKNNTSIVFCLEWRGWRLLFAGDAEERSWKEMNKANTLQPVHFLKVSHHASHNGTPGSELLDKVLPETPPDDWVRSALVSTWEDTYSGVPDSDTIQVLGARCDELIVVHEASEPGGHVDVLFEAP